MPFGGNVTLNEHTTLDTAPPEILESLGSVLQRLNSALKQVPGVARLHYGRFNDGGEHWHARTLGMMQARGVMSYLWADTLPIIPIGMWRENSRIIAEAMSANGGESLVNR